MGFKYNPQHHIISKLKPGKQGLVGTIYDKSIKKTKVYKFSTLLNKNGTHEHNIIQSLKKVYYCPYFIADSELVIHTIDSEFENADNIFNLKSKHKIDIDICLSEYINDSRKFTSFIEHSKQVNETIIISILKQSLLAVLMAKQEIGFTHYDLHSENILVQKCPYDDVYVWYDSKLNIPYVIPSLGYLPRIIDYGFSYADSVDNQYIISPLDFMKEGYLSFKTDEFADFRILLTSMLEELYYNRHDNPLFHIQKNIVKKLFKDINIDWGSGWLCDNKSCAVKYLYEMCMKCKQYEYIFESPTIDEHFYAILDLLQVLIKSPIPSDPFPNKSMEEVFNEFMFGFKEFYKHFMKLEYLFETNSVKEDEYIPNPTMGLYIVRSTIDCILATRDEYDEPGKSANAVRKFKNMLFDVIRKNTKFHLPKINYEKYMVSFYVMANALQSLLYREIQYRVKYIDKQYSKMNVETSNDIFYILNYYLDVPYHYTTNTRLIFMDCESKSSKIYKLSSDQSFHINTNCKNSIDVSQFIYDLIENELKPVMTTSSSQSIKSIIYSDNCSTESPNNLVSMQNWSDSEDESDASSTCLDFDIKYDWNIDEEYDSDEEVSSQYKKSILDIEYYAYISDEEE